MVPWNDQVEQLRMPSIYPTLMNNCPCHDMSEDHGEGPLEHWLFDIGDEILPMGIIFLANFKDPY